MTPALHELDFPAMWTRVRLLASHPGPLPAVRAEVEQLAARLTRFDARSELCRLNADPRPVAPASADLRAAVRAAMRGAELTGGLADPTLLGALERAGYARSLTGVPRTPLRSALAAAPARRAARPHDCGGDMRVHGAHEVLVAHPFGAEPAASIPLSGGAAATSGVDARLWGTSAHHLLDPATGEPAWTGVVSATALAPTGAEAEALAMAALLAGPDAGRALLERRGGVLVLDDGAVVPAPREVLAA